MVQGLGTYIEDGHKDKEGEEMVTGLPFLV